MKGLYKSLSRIKLIFVVTAAGLLSVSILAFIRVKSLSDTARIVNHTNVIKLQLEKSISYLKDAETGQRGYLLTRDTEFLSPYRVALENEQKCLSNLDTLLADNPVQVRNMVRLHYLVNTRLAYLTGMIQQSYNEPVSTLQLKYGKRLMDSSRAHITQMVKEENDNLRSHNRALQNAAFVTPFVIIILILFSLLVLIASYFFITKELRRSMNLQGELASRNNFVESILDTSVDLIAAFDRDFSYLTVNNKLAEVIGLPKENIYGRKLTEFKPYIDQNRAYAAMKEALAGNTVHVSEYYSDFTRRYYENAYIPLKDANGSLYGILSIGHDITLSIEAREHLQKANNELRERNQLIEALIDSSTDIIIGFDEDLHITIFNKKAAEILGISKEFAVGNTVSDILPSSLISENYNNILAALKGQATLQNLMYFNVVNRWMENSIVPLKKNGEVNGVLYFGHDMTEIMEVQSQLNESNKQLQLSNINLKQSEDRFHRMTAGVQDYAIIFLSQDGFVENWNKGAEKIKGYKEEEIIGKHFSIFYTPDSKEAKLPESLLNEALIKGRTMDEGWRLRKDQRPFWAQVVITAIHDEHNHLLGFLKVTRDLTERKLAEDQIKEDSAMLEKKNRQLEKINEELASFAYVSSHDLQEPLRKIQTFANQIIENEYENLSDNAKNYFKRIQVAANRMQNLIKDLLAYSRINTGERKYELTDLNELVEEVKNELKEEIIEKSAVVETSGLCKAYVVHFQIRQLLYNLISNALKFSRVNIPPHITITAKIVSGEQLKKEVQQPSAYYCHLSIRDNGIGFDPKFKHRIFEVFQRLHPSDKYPGTGIGLAICKKIVENHHGFVNSISEIDKGTTFNIYFPQNEVFKGAV